MVIDVVTYAGDREKELFEIRYNVLKGDVDEFRVFEFDTTFSGKPKKSTFNQFYPNVNYYFITEDQWGKYRELARQSPNTEYGRGAEHWITEFAQKESIKDCLTDLQDDDIVYLGDCDEIWKPFLASKYVVFKIKLRVYTYWLNNRSSEEFWGTIVGRYKNIRGRCLNELRSKKHIKVAMEWGWHFTSLAPYLEQKLKDSYTEETYASRQIIDNLSSSIEQNKDFLGRGFIFKRDESDWPKYLLENKNRYSQLCLKTS